MDPVNANVSHFMGQLHNGEHVEAISEIVELVKEDVETIPEAQASMTVLEEASEHENLLFKLSPDSPETQEIAAYDKERDRAWWEAKRLLKFYAQSHDAAIKAAAEALLRVLKTYGDAPVINLFEETGFIKHALNDLLKPEHEQHVALIPGLSELLDILKTANTELSKHYIQRLKDAEEAKKLGKLGDYRKHVDTLFINLCKVLNILYNYNEITVNDPVIKNKIQRIADNIDALLTQLKKNIDRRGKKPGSGKQKPDITNPEVPGTDTPDPEDPGEGGDGGDEGEGGDPGEGGDGGTENPDIENPPPPPFLPDFE